MSKNISKSVLIKIISSGLAVVLMLSGGCIYFYKQSERYKLALENTYRNSLQDLNDYVNNIYSYLDKGLYVGTAYQLSNISANLLSDSRAAKICLASLPASELRLDNTFKFLSQVGSYASALNKKYHFEDEITENEYKSLENLRGYAKKLNSYISNLEYDILKNNSKIGNGISLANTVKVKNQKQNNSNLDFSDLEKEFEGYPTLIYDGPFSDNITNRTPELTKGMKKISVEQAKKIVALAAGISENKLINAENEKSNMPLYCFKSDNFSAGVTQKGGVMCYILKSRTINTASVDVGEAINIAKQYVLDVLKITNIEQSYYEVNGNYCTINFACKQNDVIIYPDLIKISVALDNGEIISMDARGYINNHKERNIKTPKKTSEEAEKVLSKYLTVVKKPRLAFVPTEGENEVLTYEFVCRGKNDENVMVYINSDNLEEEQILILVESENGVLVI